MSSNHLGMERIQRSQLEQSLTDAHIPYDTAPVAPEVSKLAAGLTLGAAAVGVAVYSLVRQVVQHDR